MFVLYSKLHGEPLKMRRTEVRGAREVMVTSAKRLLRLLRELTRNCYSVHNN